MSGVIVRLSPIYAHVALNMWALEEVMVLRFDCRPLDPGPLSVAEWKAIHGTWKRRNARVIARMMERREVAA